MTLTLATLAFLAIAAYAALSDLATRRVANGTNVLLLGAGLAVQLSAAGATGIFAAALGALVGLAILIVPFSRHWVGGGDVKFLAAAGAGLGPGSIFVAALVGLALAGVWAATLLARRATLRSEVRANLGLAAVTLSAPEVRRRSKDEVIPLVVPLAVAAVAVLMAGGPS